MASITQRFLVPVSTASVRNAWHNDPHLYIKYDEKNTRGTSKKIGWRGVARFLKPLPYFRPKSVIFPTLFSDLMIKWIKNHNLWLGTYLYSLYKRLPPPPQPRDAKNALQIMSLTAYTTWTNERKDNPSEWSTFSQLSHFSKESHWRQVGFPLTERFRTSLELFGTSLDILNNMSKDVPTNFVLLWDPYEKSRHSQDKKWYVYQFKKVGSRHLHSLVSFLFPS